MQLAKLRENDHPADALGVYKRQVEPVIDRKNNDAYHEAVTLIQKIRQLMKRLGRQKEFGGYVTSIRDTHRRKRNLTALLDRIK